MTTTLRPAGPERRAENGARTRTYLVCVNSRPVGTAEIATDPVYGESVGRVEHLEIDEPDRRRGRGTVAALAAEEVLRSWGCARVEVAVPEDAEHALRMAVALGYSERNRHMTKTLDGDRPALPAGSVLRPMSEEEYEPWQQHERAGFLEALVERGVPRAQAEAHEATAYRVILPDGLATAGSELLALDHGGSTVGHLWLRVTEPAWVFSVEVVPDRRGEGHGRTLMLAAEGVSQRAGAESLQLNVFAGNTPALRLYESLGYRITERHFAKVLC